MIDIVTLAEIVPAAASRWPDGVALRERDLVVTWTEVEARTAALASALRTSGVGSGEVVVVCTQKSLTSFVVMHGVLRAGAVIAPIDPRHPAATIVDLVTSFDPAAVIVDAAGRHSIGDLSQLDLPSDRVVDVDLDHSTGADGDARSLVSCLAEPVVDLPALEPTAPAYIISTSGSTGAPKGIVHTHRSGLAYARLAAGVHGLRADDRVAGMPPLHFDMSTLELYAAPLVGASIVPISDAELRFPASFVERSEADAVTVWYSVPFQLRQIAERGGLDRRDLSSLRHVIYAGEPYPARALRQLLDQLPPVRCTNAYGPAETNVCTIHEITALDGDDVPLGRPWGDTRIKVVDPDQTADDTATATEGELWVSGSIVMSGYWKRPDLTASRLIDCADDASTTAWYRTGDLVRLDPDGVLWFLGRVDNQVKIRGTRLELEAIESVVEGAPGVETAVVGPNAAFGEADHLVAAVVVADDWDERAFRSHCRAKLPLVAVPTDIRLRTDLARTSSGKVDRRAIRAEITSDQPAATPHS